VLFGCNCSRATARDVLYHKRIATLCIGGPSRKKVIDLFNSLLISLIFTIFKIAVEILCCSSEISGAKPKII